MQAHQHVPQSENGLACKLAYLYEQSPCGSAEIGLIELRRPRTVRMVAVAFLLTMAVARSTFAYLPSFQGCGVLIPGAETGCVLFQADAGGTYILANYGGFLVGDRVQVAGSIDALCITTCQQGNGCIINNTIMSGQLNCPCMKHTNIAIDLSTGVGYDGGFPNSIAPGFPDDTWRVTCDANGGTINRFATVVATHPAWDDLPVGSWISIDPNQGNGAPLGEYCYQTCFCLNDGFQNASLSFDVLADDSAAVFLNGNSVPPGSTPAIALQLPSTHFSTSDPSLFKAGTNCIEVRVTNTFQTVTGFSLTGQVTADNAQCCPICTLAGDQDNFAAPGGPNDTIVFRPAFQTWFGANANQFCAANAFSLPFDSVDSNCSFGYSFQGLANFCCPAELTIRMKFGGSNDNLALVFIPIPPHFAWDASRDLLGSFNGLGELELAGHPATGVPLCTHTSGTADGNWSLGDDMTCVLDLCALPLGDGGRFNAQPDIRNQTALDIYVQDDTGVDYLNLCYEPCKGPATIPTVSQWGLVVMTLLMLCGAKVYFARRRAVVGE